MEMQMSLRQNMEYRQTLIQKLGLKSEFFESCLVRSEKLLKQREYQRGISLVRKLADEDQYKSVLDFLMGLFVPSMKPDIFEYYNCGTGKRLIAQRSWSFIDLLDRKMVIAIQYLARLSKEFWVAGLENKNTRTEITAAEVDLILRPIFPVVTPMLELQSFAA